MSYVPIIKSTKSYLRERKKMSEDGNTNQTQARCLTNMVIDKHQPSPALGHSCRGGLPNVALVNMLRKTACI